MFKHLYPQSLFEHLPSTSRSGRLRTELLSKLYAHPLDRVQVLGDDEERFGHTGCVNALSWAQEGQLLLSGGDDRTVRIWRTDSSRSGYEPYPFSCSAVIHTGHTANIFNVKMLPNSNRIATVAGDRQVRVFDVGNVPTAVEREISHTPTHLLRCHEDRVKRIVTEDSPDAFLTVSEDGTVRQHDLRSSHICRSGCPTPLVQMDHELTSLSLSPLTPYQFVVAGDSLYGYLFDRRNLRTRPSLQSSKELTTCTRRFAKQITSPQSPHRRDHITGVRMCASSSDEVLMAYSGDAVYRFSTLGDAVAQASTPPSVLPSNEELEDESESDTDPLIDAAPSSNGRLDVPTIPPLQRYVGARNAETVKDVNFLGPNDEYVTVGSDEGYFFIWKKEDGALHGIYEGDSSVVNVIEGHPHVPLIAVSGIDTTVKVFAPNFDRQTSLFSKTGNAASIMERNSQPRRAVVPRLDMFRLYLAAHLLDPE